jgi:cellulose synthase/poly-beta-1,6-N-acetylglucosamine synthase-like glycosyltransferase
MKEEKTVGKCLESLILGYSKEFEICCSIPDELTYNALMKKAQELNIESKIYRSQISKSGKPAGKPKELNELMQMAKGDIWVFVDGDTYFGSKTLDLLEKKLLNTDAKMVSGRPIASNSKDTMMGFWGNLLADVAHKERGLKLNKNQFFPVSGYLFAMLANKNINLPIQALSEDAYISAKVFFDNQKIVYEPKAKVFVKYPTTLEDYFKQKKRSLGGFHQKGVSSKQMSSSRSILKEISYALFPLKYATNFKQFIWALYFYPVRFWLWIIIFWERKILNKSFDKTWQRVESTK